MPLRVLQVNKFFYPRAGAETAYLQTRQLLSSRGDTVIDFAMADPANLSSPYEEHFAPMRAYDRSGGALRRVFAAGSAVYSRSARAKLASLLDSHSVDVAHLHNVYHQLTLSVVDELYERGVPIVMTLHDWKPACPAYTLFTEGAPCRRCPTSGVRNAVKHRCVKGSRAASMVAAAEATLAHRRRTYSKVSRYIAPSRFAVEVAELAGIDRTRVHHIPNFLPDAELYRPHIVPPAEPSVLFVGRLDATKGIRELLTAFALVPRDVRLRIVGAGELEEEVRRAANNDPRITYLGRLPRETMSGEYERARVVVLPSIWEDNGPFVVLEAQAHARALVVTDRGGPKEFVRDGETGLVVDPTDSRALADAIARLAMDGPLAAAMGERALAAVRSGHSAQAHYSELITTYKRAIGDR